MPRAFSRIAYTPSVRAAQDRYGSRTANAAFDLDPDPRDTITRLEREFVAARDSFFMSSVGESGWPYVQHRGGPKGFLKVVDERTLGFADFSGNRQYISAGNIMNDDRVMLFLMDYPNRRRLKIWGRARIVHESEFPDVMAALEDGGYRARVERGYLITVEALDFNCPQHITPRFTEEEIAARFAPLRAQIADLQSRLAIAEPPTPLVLGSGPLELTVAGIRQLTPEIRAYELRSVHGGDLPVVTPGSHLLMPVLLEGGDTDVRRYSIASNPGRRDVYDIAVRRDERGRGGALSVHRNYQLGTVLRCELPANSFPLHDDSRPAVLIAGGIGITALKPMAQALKTRQRPFHLHYVARAPVHMAYRAKLEAALPEHLTLYFSQDRSRPNLDLDHVFDQAAEDTVFYVCGPNRLIEAVIHAGAQRGIPPSRVRFERFAAPGPNTTDESVDLVLEASGKALRVHPGETVLDAVLAAGVGVPFSCRVGTCGTCAVRVAKGIPDHRDSALTDEQRERGRLMCICVSRARGSHLALEL